MRLADFIMYVNCDQSNDFETYIILCLLSGCNIDKITKFLIVLLSQTETNSCDEITTMYKLLEIMMIE